MKFTVTACLGLLLAGCEPPTPAMPQPSAAVKGQPLDPSSTTAIVRASLDVIHATGWEQEGRGHVAATELAHWVVLNHIHVHQGTERQQILVIASRPVDHDCHACQPAISLFAWSHRAPGATFRLLAHSTYITAMGSWGEPPDATLVSLPNGEYHLELQDHYMAQGIEDHVMVRYQPMGTTFVEVYRKEMQVDHNRCSHADTGCL